MNSDKKLPSFQVKEIDKTGKGRLIDEILGKNFRFFLSIIYNRSYIIVNNLLLLTIQVCYASIILKSVFTEFNTFLMHNVSLI